MKLNNTYAPAVLDSRRLHNEREKDRYEGIGGSVLRDLRGSQSEPLLALLSPTTGCRNSSERPVPLRRDEVALQALHLELLLPPMDL